MGRFTRAAPTPTKRNSLNQSPLEDSLPRQIHKFLCFSTQMQSNALDEMGKHRTFIPDNWPRCDIHAGEKVRRTSDYLLQNPRPQTNQRFLVASVAIQYFRYRLDKWIGI